MKKIILMLGILTLSTVNSCTSSNDEIAETKNFTESQIAKKVNLVSNKIDASLQNKINIVVFEVYIGRSSQNCLRGWGFCRFTWFPLVNDSDGEIADSDKLLVQEQKDSLQRKYFEIHAGSEVPADIPDSELSLIVDNDMTTYAKDGERVTLKTGTYLFDRNIGEYGGYRVYLQ